MADDFLQAWRQVGLPEVDRAAAPLPPLALPLPLLPYFSAARLRRAGRRVPSTAVAGAALAGVLGYLTVRLHDDRIDEAKGSEQTALLLGSALLGHHARLLVRAAGHRGAVAMGDALAEAWGAYAAGMAAEAEAIRSGIRWTEPLWRASLQRYAPLALPTLAVLARAGRTAEFAAARQLFAEFGEAHQLFEDVVDLARDVPEKRAGWVAELCGANQTGLAGAMFGYLGGVGVPVQAAHAALGRARAIAGDLGEFELVGHFDARAAAMDAWLAQRQSALVEAWMAASAVSVYR